MWKLSMRSFIWHPFWGNRTKSDVPMFFLPRGGANLSSSLYLRHCPQAEFFLDFSHFLEFELQNNVRQTLPNQKLRSGSEPTLTSTFFGLLKIWVLPTARTHPSLTHNHGVRSAPTIPLAALDHTASPIRPITTKFKLPTDDMAIMNLVRYRIHR